MNDTGKPETTETDSMKGQAVLDVSVCEVNGTVYISNHQKGDSQKRRVSSREVQIGICQFVVYILCAVMFVEFIFVVDILPPMKLLNGFRKKWPQKSRVDVKKFRSPKNGFRRRRSSMVVAVVFM